VNYTWRPSVDILHFYPNPFKFYGIFSLIYFRVKITKIEILVLLIFKVHNCDQKIEICQTLSLFFTEGLLLTLLSSCNFISIRHFTRGPRPAVPPVHRKPAIQVIRVLNTDCFTAFKKRAFNNGNPELSR
jgi:hypothetical protein